MWSVSSVVSVVDRVQQGTGDPPTEKTGCIINEHTTETTQSPSCVRQGPPKLADSYGTSAHDAYKHKQLLLVEACKLRSGCQYHGCCRQRGAGRLKDLCPKRHPSTVTNYRCTVAMTNVRCVQATATSATDAGSSLGLLKRWAKSGHLLEPVLRNEPRVLQPSHNRAQLARAQPQ
jgi:hypothetical protein